MTPTHLLDTGWVIRHLRGAKAYADACYRIGIANLAVSIVSLAELYEGVYRAADRGVARQKLITYISDKTILPLTPEICDIFGEHRARLRQQNQLIGDLDLLIAATCLHHHLTLLTTNLRHFERIPGLTIISQPIP